MVEKVSWAARIEVDGGPMLSAANESEIEAYDKVALTLPAGAVDKQVDLQPSDTKQVVMLMITATPYDKAITCKPESVANAITLDAPLFLVGSAAIGLLGAKTTTLKLSNGTANDVRVDIFVGRDATP